MMINFNLHSFITEFIKLVTKCDKMLGKSRIVFFFSAGLINSINHDHSCKILYVNIKNMTPSVFDDSNEYGHQKSYLKGIPIFISKYVHVT